MKTITKLRTIEDVCNRPTGSFQQSLKEKEAYLKAREEDRRARIQKHGSTAQKIAWAV